MPVSDPDAVGEPWIMGGDVIGQLNPPLLGHYVKSDDPLVWTWQAIQA